ncbi:MAG: hypothetical protein HFI47_08810 [Lachnospiraceae bacterium]|jgi:predicted nuclease with TOPRIM domain|nr:hypothetical protein [Lachnospiraceae bacterium]
MERLTERTGEGQAIPRMDLRNNGHQKCMQRLAEYEELGLEPDEIRQYVELAEKMNVCDLVRENARLSCKIKFLEAQLNFSGGKEGNI